MAKGRILVFLRVSTEAQELDNQRNEMRDFVNSMGYSDIIYVEGIGASAIKINDEYIEMYAEVRKHIENGDISAVAVWAVNRLARDEEWFIRFKKLFIENKIQFIVKNPTLSLLNEDGSVNAGSELALSLFSTMAKQDMEEKKAKFSRTKRAYSRVGRYSGGKTLKFGYRLDESRFFVEDENDGAMVRLIFELYSTGGHSVGSISDELNARGWKRSDGLPINPYFIARIIKCRSYYGAPDENCNGRVYPALISEELFDRCREVAHDHRLMRTGERIVMSSKLVRCPECGALFTCNSRHLSCCRNVGRHRKCGFNLQVRQDVSDAMLWRLAYAAHVQYLLDLKEETVAQYKAEVEVLDQKIATIEDKMSKAVDKKKRVIDTYLEEYITKEERDARLARIEAESVSQKEELNALRESRNALLRLIESATSALDRMHLAEKSPKEKYDIIHKHIQKVVPERISFGIRDPRTTRPNGVLFNIYMTNGSHHKLLFIPKSYQGHSLYIWDEPTQAWLPEALDLDFKNILPTFASLSIK